MAKFKLPDDLYEFQKEDVAKLVSNSNWLVFNEMGTGKTPTALGAIEKNKYECPLIICPNSLKLEWARQINDWVGEDQVAVSSQDCYNKLGPIIYSFQNGQKYKVINYETLRNKDQVEMLNMIPFDVVVLDEVHKLRNCKAKLVNGTKNRMTGEHEGGAWQFFNAHPKAKVIALSGSPIMNYPNDLYGPLTMCYPDQYPRTLPAWNKFMYRYCFYGTGRFGSYAYGYRNMEHLREETKAFTIRRTKKEVLPWLPDKYYRRVLLSMKSDQRTLYEQMEKELKITLDNGEPLWSPTVVSQIIRLRQLNLDPKIVGVTTSSAKTEFLQELVDDMGDQKLVVFSCFEKYIFLLSSVYFKDIPHIVITGEVPIEKRAEEIKRFQNDESVKLALCTIQTGGEGITLTASSNVILVDRWWNEPTNAQAVDRLHRIGQENKVQVIIPVVEDSIDKSLDEILSRKEGAAQEFLQEKEVRRLVLEDRRIGK